MKRCLMLLWLSLSAAQPAAAHTLASATAQLTLRDGQVAVTAHLDLLALMHTLPTPEGAPLGLLAVADPEAFNAIIQEVRQLLQRHTALRVDGAPVPTLNWQLPDPAALREQAQLEWMAQAVDDHRHPTLSTVSFEAKLSHPPAAITVQLPDAIGPVLISFVQPVSQLAAPGSAVTFRPKAPSTSAATAATHPGHDAAP